MAQQIRKEQSDHDNTDYKAIVRSAKFHELLQKKKNFILPMSIFFFVFYFALPIMTSYTKILNAPAVGAITWAWVFAFAQFVMTWTLCILYTRKSKQFDSMVEQIKEEAKRGGKA